MDSWTDKQLALMKTGGNDKCNDYLKAKGGIDARTPIKPKYEAPVAQLYKEILKARVEGRPEPTELPKPATKKPMGDASGMERLAGETDQQYIARQTQLREAARARMASKFGNSGGVGSGGGGGSRMAGIGSDPSYNPNGGYGGPSDLNVDKLIYGFGSFATSMTNTVSSTVQSTLTQENVNAIKSTGASFWGSLTTGVSTVATTLTKPAEEDGLAQLQREVASHKPMASKYTGFGGSASGAPSGFSSGSTGGSASNTNFAAPPATPPRPPSSGGHQMQEASGLPGEDRNGIERLTGESDDQYIVRQTRLRDEARARMAAKFGGGGLSSASSSPAPVAPRAAPSSGNMSTGSNSAPRSAPSSGNAKASSFAKQSISSDDFFSSFGS
jgi:ADP-ribosylation factor GTPase-activating protein 1